MEIASAGLLAIYSLSDKMNICTILVQRFIKIGGFTMLTENRQTARHEEFIIQLTSPMLYDRLQTLSSEYSLSVEFLVNVAVQRLVEDVDFVRNLRTGQVHLG